MQPSIIFFDEIDGLAPTRSGRNDQAHNSIVSTLLTVMDGVESRGQVCIQINNITFKMVNYLLYYFPNPFILYRIYLYLYGHFNFTHHISYNTII